MLLRSTKESRELVQDPRDARKVIEAASQQAKLHEIELRGRRYTVVELELRRD